MSANRQIFYHGQPILQPVVQQQRETSRFVKFWAWFLGLTLVPAFAYLWWNGGVFPFCSGTGGRVFPAACPQPYDYVTDAQAEAYARRLTAHIDGGDTLDRVYDQDMRPRADRTADVEKDAFAKLFDRIDHLEYLGNLQRARTNTFTFHVLSWKTTPRYSFADDQRPNFHRNARDEYVITIYLTAGSSAIEDVWSSLPAYDRDDGATFGTHDAPVFTFVKRGRYYKDADKKAGTREHGASGQLAAICVWAPPEARDRLTITDYSKLMVRTYVGWVKYREIRFVHDSHFSTINDRPKDIWFCRTPQ